MAMSKIERIDKEIQKTREKITEYQNRLRGLDLYVTLEPCTMCAAAISMARIKTLYFGAMTPKAAQSSTACAFTIPRPVITGRKSAAGFWRPNAAKFLKDSFATSAERFNDWH